MKLLSKEEEKVDFEVLKKGKFDDDDDINFYEEEEKKSAMNNLKRNLTEAMIEDKNDIVLFDKLSRTNS